MRVFIDVQARLCDECRTDQNHDVEYTIHATDYAVEVIRCHTCGHTDSMTYTGDDL